MTQIWIALITILLLAYYKFKSQIDESLTQILKLIRTNLFVRKNLLELLNQALFTQNNSVG